MAESRLEEATRCPKCGKPGEDRKTLNVGGKNGLPIGTKVHLIYCTTKLCRWYNTCWQVQVRPDGTIPDPKNHTGSRDKIYAGFEGHDDQAKNLIENLKEMERAQQEGHAEIQNPFAR